MSRLIINRPHSLRAGIDAGRGVGVGVTGVVAALPALVPPAFAATTVNV